MRHQQAGFARHEVRRRPVRARAQHEVAVADRSIAAVHRVAARPHHEVSPGIDGPLAADPDRRRGVVARVLHVAEPASDRQVAVIRQRGRGVARVVDRGDQRPAPVLLAQHRAVVRAVHAGVGTEQILKQRAEHVVAARTLPGHVHRDIDEIEDVLLPVDPHLGVLLARWSLGSAPKPQDRPALRWLLAGLHMPPTALYLQWNTRRHLRAGPLRVGEAGLAELVDHGLQDRCVDIVDRPPQAHRVAAPDQDRGPQRDQGRSAVARQRGDLDGPRHPAQLQPRAESRPGGGRSLAGALERRQVVTPRGEHALLVRAQRLLPAQQVPPGAEAPRDHAHLQAGGRQLAQRRSAPERIAQPLERRERLIPAVLAAHAAQQIDHLGLDVHAAPGRQLEVALAQPSHGRLAADRDAQQGEQCPRPGQEAMMITDEIEDHQVRLTGALRQPQPAAELLQKDHRRRGRSQQHDHVDIGNVDPLIEHVDRRDRLELACHQCAEARAPRRPTPLAVHGDRLDPVIRQERRHELGVRDRCAKPQPAPGRGRGVLLIARERSLCVRRGGQRGAQRRGIEAARSPRDRRVIHGVLEAVIDEWHQSARRDADREVGAKDQPILAQPQQLRPVAALGRRGDPEHESRREVAEHPSVSQRRGVVEFVDHDQIEVVFGPARQVLRARERLHRREHELGRAIALRSLEQPGLAPREHPREGPAGLDEDLLAMGDEQHPPRAQLRGVEGREQRLAEAGGQHHEPTRRPTVPCQRQRGEGLALDLVRQRWLRGRIPADRRRTPRGIFVDPLGGERHRLGRGPEPLEAGPDRRDLVSSLQGAQVPLHRARQRRATEIATTDIRDRRGPGREYVRFRVEACEALASIYSHLEGRERRPELVQLAQGFGVGDAEVVAGQHAHDGPATQRVLEVVAQQRHARGLDERGQQVGLVGEREGGLQRGQEPLLLPADERRQPGERRGGRAHAQVPHGGVARLELEVHAPAGDAQRVDQGQHVDALGDRERRPARHRAPRRDQDRPVLDARHRERCRVGLEHRAHERRSFAAHPRRVPEPRTIRA